MDIITTARRFEMTPALRAHAEKRLRKLQRYLDHIQEVHLVMTQEKYRHIAEVALHAHGTNLISREESGDMMTSIDRVIDRVERQIKKLSAKIRVRGRKERRVPLREVTAGVGVVAEDRAIEEDAEEDVEEEGEEEEEFCPVVVQGVQYHPQPVTVEEAIQVMRDKDWDFILFNNAKTDKMSLLHIREDGNFGFVEPS